MRTELPEKDLGIIIVRTCMDSSSGAADWYAGTTGFLSTFFPGTTFGGVIESNVAGMAFMPNNSTNSTPTDFTQIDAHIRNPGFANLTDYRLFYYPNIGLIAAPYVLAATTDAQVWSAAKITNARAHIRRLADHFTDAKGPRGISMLIGTHDGDLTPQNVSVNANLATQKSNAIARYVQLDAAVWAEMRGSTAPFQHHAVVCPTVLSTEGARADTSTTFYRASDYATYNNGEFLNYCDAWNVSCAHRGMSYEDGISGLVGSEPPTNVGSFLNVWRALKAGKTAHGGSVNIPIVSMISTVGSQSSQYIGTASGEWATDDTTLNGKMLLRSYRLGLELAGMFYWSVSISGWQALAFMPDEQGATGTELERGRGVNGTINMFYLSATNTLSAHHPALDTFLLISDVHKYILPTSGAIDIPDKTWQYISTNPDNGYHLPYNWFVCAKAYNAPVSTAIATAPWAEWAQVSFSGGEIISSAGVPKLICRPVILPKHIDWKVSGEAQCTGGGIAQICVRGFDLTDGEAVIRSEVAPDAYNDTPLEVTFRPVGHNLRAPNPARVVVVCYHNGIGEARFKNFNIDVSPPPFVVEPPLEACVGSTTNRFLNPFSSATAYKRPLGDGAQYAGDSHSYTSAWNANNAGSVVLIQNPGTGYGFGVWDTSSTTGTFSTSVTVDTGKTGAIAAQFPVTVRLPNGFSQTQNGANTTDQNAAFWDGTVFHDFRGLRTVTVGSAYVARTHYAHDGGAQGHGGAVLSSSASAMWLEGMVLRGPEWNDPTNRCEHALAISLGSRPAHYATQLGPTFVWPAVSGSLDTTNVGVIPYGQLFAIPPLERGGPDPATLGLGATSDTVAWRLYYVLMWRGMFVTDQSAVPTIRCDQSLLEAVRLELVDAIHILYPFCRAVTNVGTG